MDMADWAQKNGFGVQQKDKSWVTFLTFQNLDLYYLEDFDLRLYLRAYITMPEPKFDVPN